MKTRRLSTIMMSAYLSAMLASSLAPTAGNITLAAAVAPPAAEAAFRQALISTAAAGWTTTSDIPVPPMATAQIVASKTPAPAGPILSEEALNRLIAQMAGQQKPATIPAGVCAHFKLCDGTAKLPMRMVQTSNPKGNFLGQPWEGNPTVIIVARRMEDGTVHFFLTDKSLKPLSAVSSANGVATVLDLAASKPTYEAALTALAQAAAPPAGETVASK